MNCERETRHDARTAHSIIWAVLILATSIILSAAKAGDVFMILLPVVLVPLWFASDRLVLHLVRIFNRR